MTSERASQRLLVELGLRAFLKLLMGLAVPAFDDLIERLRAAVRLAPALELDPMAVDRLLQLGLVRGHRVAQAREERAPFCRRVLSVDLLVERRCRYSAR